MPRADTREQILSAAELLFAERGYAATSMRAITRSAGVNLAAVNYHFGTKEALLCEVVVQRMTPINEARLHLLDRYESETGGAAIRLERVLHAFIAPVFTLTNEPFLRLIGRLYSEPVEALPQVLAEQFAPVLLRVRGALAAALPDLPRRDLYWRLEFVVGMLVHTLMAGTRLKFLTEGLCDVTDTAALIDRMVAFAAGGMRAARGTEATQPHPRDRAPEE